MKMNYRFAFIWLFLFSLVSALADPPAGPAPLKVGVTPIFPPMIYKENGTFAGVDADFAKALGQELGRPIQFVELDWADQIPALADGRIDIIMSSMSITLARQIRVNFSNPYLTIGQVAVVRREDKDYLYSASRSSRKELSAS